MHRKQGTSNEILESGNDTPFNLYNLLAGVQANTNCFNYQNHVYNEYPD